MAITRCDVLTTAVTAAVVTSYIGLVQQRSWAVVTSVRWFAVLFLLAGQVSSTLGAADAMAAGTSRGRGFLLGPVAFVAGVVALLTGSANVLGVAVASMALLWLVTTSRHLLTGHPLPR